MTFSNFFGFCLFGITLCGLYYLIRAVSRFK